MQEPERKKPALQNTILPPPYGVLAVLGGVFIVISTITRCILLAQAAIAADMTVPVLAKTFLTGFFYDIVTFTYIMAPLIALFAFVPQVIFDKRRFRLLMHCGIFALFAVLAFTAFAEYYFWQEFESRFDFVAVDYLMYRREVTDNIRQSYPLKIIFPAIGAIAILLFLIIQRPVDRCLQRADPLRRRVIAGGMLLMLPLGSMALVNDSLSTVSSNRLNNNLARNGIYSFFEALHYNHISYEQQYKNLDAGEVSRGLRLMVDPANNFIGQLDPTPDIYRTIVNNGKPEARYNVIVVVLESMSGDFLSALGGNDNLTPNLDELARQSLFFSNLYATGTRTVRGLEAIALSLPPTPPVSVLRRPHNNALFTIGTPFRRRNYSTMFFYGGHSYFDNMAEFFDGNGFTVIDSSDLSSDEVTFSSAWGVCDEDLYRRVVREADAAQGRQDNFFMMVMTTSNHKPFTYPEGKIDIPSGTGRKGAVKYADFAVGEFIRAASSKSWFDNTIFVFVADHCTRSGGKDEIPVDNYHIPCIMYAPKILQPAVIDSLASQIDIAPTLLDLLNWQYNSRFVGKSVFKTPPGQQRAFISNHLTLGYLKGDMLVALEPQASVRLYKIDPVTHEERDVQPQTSLTNEAILYYQGASAMIDAWLHH